MLAAMARASAVVGVLLAVAALVRLESEAATGDPVFAG
jgi:hypothetical protein